MKLAVDALNLRRDRRGMGRIVRSVLRLAKESGADVTLLTRERRVWPDDPDVEGLPLQLPSSAAKRKRYDAVWYPWNGIRFRSASPSLAHVHDTFALHETGLGWIARRRIRTPLRRAARHATRIATDSDWSRAQIERELRVPADRIVVILPAPDAFFTIGADFDPGLPRQPYVLVVGAGDERKNAKFLVLAFGEAFAQAEATLVVAGSLSPDAEREAAKLHLTLVRETPDDERLRALYRGAACVAVPSLAEGFGLVVVEAQACGAPVIASNTSALPEAAGEAAVLLSPFNRAAWRDALREVVFDESTASRLRALGAARWSFSDRSAPARAILATLRDLADQFA